MEYYSMKACGDIMSFETEWMDEEAVMLRK